MFETNAEGGNDYSGLAAEELFKDERVKKAKELILEAVKAHQSKLTCVRGPLTSKRQNYDEMLETFARYRGAKLWFPYLGSGLGNGVFVELGDGSVKYDFITGIGAHYLGHNHPDLISVGVDAAISNTVMQGHLQQNIDSFELTEVLVKASGLDHCFLTTSGAMANENALKIAFQKNFPAARILAFDKCFFGRTLAGSQITDKPIFREGLPTNLFVDYVPHFNPHRPEESIKSSVDIVKKFISRYPKQHAAMIFEFVQGEAGFYHGISEFFKQIMNVLKENEIAVFADEVQSFGRLPELFAFQYYGLQHLVDVATIGKLAQVSATFFTDKYKPRPGLLSQTYTSSTSAIKSSLVILNNLLNGGYFGPEGKIQQLHNYFVKKLEDLSKKHPHLVRGPFGIGCMIAFTPYDGDTKKVTRFVHRLFDAGVLSFIAGSHPTRVRFLIPAGVVTFRDIDAVVKIVEETLLKDDEKS